MGTTLQLGIREKARPTRHLYAPDLFVADGPYGSALEALSRMLFDGRGQQSWTRLERSLVLQIIHQCEEAKRWRSTQEDTPKTLINYHDEAAADLAEAATLVAKLKAIDERHPYHLRHAFLGGIEPLLPPAADLSVQIPDANHPDGGPTYKADASTKAHIEQTLIWTISLFQLDQLLHGFADGLMRGQKKPNPYYQIGCLRFSPPMSRKAAAKIRAHVAGLSAWLAYLIREWTAGRGVHPYWPGTSMPSDGRPCWRLVAEFVNSAFPFEGLETPESLRQQWHSLTARGVVRLDPWPMEAVREPQVISK